jgi:hypothetical protein
MSEEASDKEGIKTDVNKLTEKLKNEKAGVFTLRSRRLNAGPEPTATATAISTADEVLEEAKEPDILANFASENITRRVRVRSEDLESNDDMDDEENNRSLSQTLESDSLTLEHVLSDDRLPTHVLPHPLMLIMLIILLMLIMLPQ